MKLKDLTAANLEKLATIRCGSIIGRPDQFRRMLEVTKEKARTYKGNKPSAKQVKAMFAPLLNQEL